MWDKSAWEDERIGIFRLTGSSGMRFVTCESNQEERSRAGRLGMDTIIHSHEYILCSITLRSYDASHDSR